jgi:hypothetical protein
MDQLIAIFCDIDDFCKAFEPIYHRRLLHIGQRQRMRPTTLTLSEILTLLVYFHWSHYRTFKHYYMEYVAVHLRPYFPDLVSYLRFSNSSRVRLYPCVVISPRAKVAAQALPSSIRRRLPSVTTTCDSFTLN